MGAMGWCVLAVLAGSLVLVVVFLASCLGGLLGQKMLRKHFVRAGIA